VQRPFDGTFLAIHEQLEATTRRLTARAGAREQASAGEFTYRCGDRTGYTFSVTIEGYSIATPQGPHIWGVEKLAVYLSDRSTVDIARYVMNAMIASFKVDPRWQANYDSQVQSTASALMEVSNRITQASMQTAQQSMEQNMKMVQERQRMFDQMNKGMMSSYQRQQASQDALRQRRSDITLGQIHGCDDLGNCQTVSNDYQNYWTKDGRTVVGGPSDGKPPNHDPQYRKWTPDYRGTLAQRSVAAARRGPRNFRGTAVGGRSAMLCSRMVKQLNALLVRVRQAAGTENKIWVRDLAALGSVSAEAR